MFSPFYAQHFCHLGFIVVCKGGGGGGGGGGESRVIFLVSA